MNKSGFDEARKKKTKKNTSHIIRNNTEWDVQRIFARKFTVSPHHIRCKSWIHMLWIVCSFDHFTITVQSNNKFQYVGVWWLKLIRWSKCILYKTYINNTRGRKMPTWPYDSTVMWSIFGCLLIVCNWNDTTLIDFQLIWMLAVFCRCSHADLITRNFFWSSY